MSSATFASLSTGLARGVPESVKKLLMGRTIAILLRYVNNGTPVREGELKRGNRSEVVASGDYGRVYNQVSHATFVELGTKPHVIVPKRPGGVLAFMVGGKMIFTKKVNHPGTKANPFYARAVDQSEAERTAFLRYIGEQIAAEVVR